MMTNTNLPSSEAWEGIRVFFSEYVKLRQTDKVIFLYWHDRYSYVSWLALYLDIINNKYDFYSFDHRDKTKFEHEASLIIQNHKMGHEGRVIIIICENEALSFTSFLKSLTLQENVNVWRLMNVTEDLFSMALSVGPERLKKINAALLNLLLPRDSIQIKHPNGTHLKVKLDNEKFQWVSNYGLPAEGELIILPPGEINTYPAYISGTFIASGALHTNCEFPFDTRLVDDPIEFIINDNKVTRFYCKNNEIKNFIDRLFEQPYGNYIGELGIGTNIGINKFLRENTHINERHPGIHLGIGEHTQPHQVAYRALYHMDAITAGGMIHLDDESKIDISQLSQFSDEIHPLGTRCEDLEFNTPAVDQ